MEKKSNFIVQMFKNKKIRSIIFLLIWTAFIVFLFVKYAIPYEKMKANKTNDNNTIVVEDETHNEGILFEDAKKSLLKYNFNYSYTVTNPNETIIYKGTMFGNQTKGYKESVGGIEKYHVKGTDIYKEVLEEEILVTDKTLNVYNNYLSVDYIMDMIADYECIIEDNKYTFQIDAVYVKIILGIDNIEQIEIIENDNSYLLEFSNVNEITELTY